MLDMILYMQSAFFNDFCSNIRDVLSFAVTHGAGALKILPGWAGFGGSGNI